MTAIEKNNSSQLFLQYSEALDSLSRGEEPKNQESIPPDLRLHLGTQGSKIASRICQAIKKVFSEDETTEVSASEFACFVERWQAFTQASKALSLQEKGRVMEQLFKDHLRYSSFKLIEVLQKRPASSLSSTELRTLERVLDEIHYEHENFRALFYSYCFTYVGALLGIRLKQAGASMKINLASSEIGVNWDKVPLFSPEAITIAARYQAAKKNHKTSKLVREICSDLSLYDEEARKVVTICVHDFLWDKVSDMDLRFWNEVSLDSLDGLAYPTTLHPSLKKALEEVDKYTDQSEQDEKKYKEVYQPDCHLTRKTDLLSQLIDCVGAYREELQKTASLYKTGYQLYRQAIPLLKGFVPDPIKPLPDPEKFLQDAPSETSFEILNHLLPTTLEELMQLVVKKSTDRKKDWLAQIFGSPKEAKRVRDEFFYLLPKKKKIVPIEETPEDVASSYLPKELLQQKKKQRTQPIPIKKKKTHSTVAKVADSLNNLTLSSDSSPELLPAESPSPPSSPSPSNSPSLSGPSRTKKHKSCHKKRAPPAPPSFSPWISSTCLEGPAGNILKELDLPEIVIQEHVGNRFGVKNDAGEPLSWDMRAHTYPALIARLIQKFTNSRFRYSEHRDSYDLAYSCVGSMEDYGKKQKPIVGRFTEGFFSEDTVDGDKGELFHHCFYEDSSAHCIAQYEQNSAFDKDAELEDILEQRHTKGSSIDNRPFARFRTTFRPYSCIVDDIVDQVRYTLAFPRRIEVKRPTAV